jgi:hypothetical protein
MLNVETIIDAVAPTQFPQENHPKVAMHKIEKIRWHVRIATEPKVTPQKKLWKRKSKMHRWFSNLAQGVVPVLKLSKCIFGFSNLVIASREVQIIIFKS